VCIITRFFFSDSHGAHRELHSFPTRRSSDLGNDDVEAAAELGRRALGGAAHGLSVAHIGHDRQRTHALCPYQANSLFEILAARRSEEHTSELQSRENLVCRLLLEKKKKYETS